jgi:hypothetical protein
MGFARAQPRLPSACSGEVDLKGVYARLRGLWFADKEHAPTRESRAHCALVNEDFRSTREPPQQAAQVRRLESDAASGRPEARSCHVEEYGAAAVRDSRPRVVVELDDDVVEAVVAPQPIAPRLLRQSDRPVVAPVGRILAPGIGSADRPNRQKRARPRTAIRPPPHPSRAKPSLRRGAIAFPFVGANAGSPESCPDLP